MESEKYRFEETSQNLSQFLPGTVCILAGIIPVLGIIEYSKDLFLIKLGGMAWALAVTIKFLFALSFHDRVICYFKKSHSRFQEKSLCFVYGGFLTGITECGVMVLFAFRFKELFTSNYSGMLAFGVGFGSFEAICVGIGAIISEKNSILKARGKPFEVETSKERASFRRVYFPFSERLMASLNHAFSCVFSTLSVQSGHSVFFFLAFTKKVLADGFAQILQLEMKTCSGDCHSLKSFIQYRRFYFCLSIFCLLALILLPKIISFPFP